MSYLYETHVHSSQGSKCGRSLSQDMVRAYHAAGYAGMVLTDHFIFGNTAIDRTQSWEHQMREYYQAYLDAKPTAEELDFDLIFGIEHAYGDGKEVLIYGVELDFLLANPDISTITIDELVERVHKAGGIVIQAHPYRDRDYINMAVEPRADIVDGLEIYNAGDLPGEDGQALELGKTGDYIYTSGGDIHRCDDEKIGFSGVLLPYRVHTGKEFADALKKKNHGFKIHGKSVSEVRAEDLP